MRVLGLDEAGRGCVLGPLVVGGFLVDGDDAPLQQAGADDSKKLSAKKRAAIRERLRPLGQHATRAISPAQIDAGNLNTLELEAFVSLIAEFDPDKVIIDAPVHPRGIPNFVRTLRGRLDRQPELVVEPKADANYPVVGAASIFAKLQRDAAIADLGPVGSGYPSDPKTRAWIQGFFERDEPLPTCVRTRWGTIEALRQQALFGG